MVKEPVKTHVEPSYKVAEYLLEVLSRYNPDVAGVAIRYPNVKKEMVYRLGKDINAVAYGLVADFGDAVWEKLEDALSVAIGTPTGGAGLLPVEILGFLIERVILAPAEKAYHETMNIYHPNLSGFLRLYQFLTEIPGIDTVASVIPEKTLAATGALIYDVWRISRKAREYNRDYVRELYEDEKVLGVPGYIGKGDVHPVRPLKLV